MANERDEETVPAAEAELELTEREVALAQGRDPDEVVEAVDEKIEADVSGGDDGGSDVSDAGEVEATEGDVSGTDAGASPAWLTEDIKAVAGTYGLSDVDLADLDSEDDFLRLARVLERRKPAAAGGEKKSNEPAAAAEKPVAVAEQKVEPSKADEAPAIDPQKYIDAGYDEETVALARAAASMQKQLQAIVPAVEMQRKSAEEAESRRIQGEFHQLADEFGRYGKLEKLDRESDAKRQKLWEAAGAVASSILASGQKLPPMKTVLQRAEIVAFGDEIMAERRAELAKKVQSQSSRRRSVGRTTTRKTGKAVLPGEADDPVAAIMAAPEIQKFLAENAH